MSPHTPHTWSFQEDRHYGIIAKLSLSLSLSLANSHIHKLTALSIFSSSCWQTKRTLYVENFLTQGEIIVGAIVVTVAVVVAVVVNFEQKILSEIIV